MNRFKRIAISGAHGIGKTTLATKLAKHLDYQLLTESARNAAMMLNLKNCAEIESASPDRKAAFQQLVYIMQDHAERNMREFISDRSCLDIVAYMYLYGLDSTFINAYRCHAKDWTEDYDLILYCPIPQGEAKIVDDGFRLLKWQREYDELIGFLLFNNCQCEVKCLSPFRDSWFAEALAAIENAKYNKQAL